MNRLFAIGLAFLLGLPASAQVTFNITYADAPGTGFNDNTIDAGETLSRGQLRRNTIDAVLNYMTTVFDGRGSVDLHWNASTTSGGFLANFGPNGVAGVPNGSFQNGQPYQRLRTGMVAFTEMEVPHDADGQFNFGFNYNYIGANNNNNSKFDMFSVALHEFTHGMGFINYVNQNGQGLTGNSPGTPGLYSGYDKFLQRGNGAGGQLFNTDITSANFGSFIGDTSTFTNGSNATTGLFFGGEYAREVFNSPIPLHAPGTFSPGSSIGHLANSPNGVMNFSVSPGVEERAYQNFEIAMLLDLGYNVYNWNGNTNSSWSGGDVDSLAASPWRTDMGIVYNGSQIFNTHNNPSQAPILAPYAQVTSNIVLNFAGSGAASYTATNDLGSMRMSRINLNSTSTGTNTITGGTFIFGQNSDGSFSVLAPKIVQKGSGAFNFGSTIQIADPVRGLTVDGPGTGTVTFDGNFTGTGGLSKAGTFLMVMNGASNSYLGTTNVTQGTLRVNGNITGTSGVSISSGAQLALHGGLTVNGDITGSGALNVNPNGRLEVQGSVETATTVSGNGVVAPGNSAGNTTFTGGLSMNEGVYEWELATLSTSGGGTNYDMITLNGGTSVFGANSSVELDFGLLAPGLDPDGGNSFWNSTRQWQIVTLASGTFTGIFGSIANGVWTAGEFTLSASSIGIFLTFTPVPEPSPVLLLFVVGLGWMVIRRFRTRASNTAK